MNKLNFLISHHHQVVDFPESLYTQAMFSFSIANSKNIEQFKPFFLHTCSIYLSSEFSFSLHFNLIENNKLNKSLLADLLKNKNLFLQFIFHPHFKRCGNKPVIFLSMPSENANMVMEFTSLFESHIVLQGYDGVEWIYFNNTEQEHFNPIFHFGATDEFENYYYSLLEQNEFILNTLGIITNYDINTEHIVKIKLLAEQKFKETHPSKYAFLKEYHQLHNEVPQLKEKLKRTTEDLINQKTYLNIIREEDEANKINRFYYYEYEILPLWFKKIGHLIKVLTGKRRLRSLFNNNIKKYKH